MEEHIDSMTGAIIFKKSKDELKLEELIRISIEQEEEIEDMKSRLEKLESIIYNIYM